MRFYVRIQRLSGRNDHVILGSWLNQSGVGEVDYYQGGWDDTNMNNIAPHLKFEREDDAIAYVLAHGGEITRSIPEMVPEI
jgi:hypothetical protein